MTALEKARARLKELGAKLDDLMAKENLSADELKDLDDTVATFESVEKEIEALERAEKAKARAAIPAAVIPASDRDDNQQDRVEPQVKRDLNPDQKFSLIASAVVKASGTGQPALKFIHEGGYADFAKDLEREMKRKALDTAAASVLIPDVLAREVIDFLRPETTFFQGNPRRVTFTHGKFEQARGSAGATAGYVGEAQKKPVTDVGFDGIAMSAKKLAAFVIITKEAKEWPIIDTEEYVRGDLQATMAQTIDQYAYFGAAGNPLAPVGILNKPGVVKYDAHAFEATDGSPTIAEVDAFASALILSLTQANIAMNMRSWKWLMSYRTFEFLKNMRVGDHNGAYAYPELHLPVPTWKNFGVLVSNQVPENLGAGSSSLIALIDFRHVLYGEEGGILVKTSEEATIDVNGTLHHLFQQNEMAILTEHQHDFALRYTRAVAVGENVDWGAVPAGAVGSP